MKTLLISLICTCASMSLFAQADTTNTTNNGTYNNTDTTGTMNANPTYTDTSGTMQNNNNMNNSNMNSTTDTSAYMNSSSTTTNTSATNNNWNNSMQNNNTAMATQRAALPVRETFVPQNIIDQANQKYPNGQVYDITAVKSAEDTMTQNSNTTAWNSSNNNNNSSMDNDHDKDDSSQTAMNQNTTNNQYRDSSVNQTNASANTSNNMSNNNMNNNNENAPEKFDYVVRVMQGGQMVTEKLYSDGTALRERNASIHTTGELTSQ